MWNKLKKFFGLSLKERYFIGFYSGDQLGSVSIRFRGTIPSAKVIFDHINENSDGQNTLTNLLEISKEDYYSFTKDNDKK